jgi:hypothetical protein
VTGVEEVSISTHLSCTACPWRAFVPAGEPSVPAHDCGGRILLERVPHLSMRRPALVRDLVAAVGRVVRAWRWDRRWRRVL